MPSLTAANMRAIDVAEEFCRQTEQVLGELQDPIMLADLHNAIANTLDGSDPRTALARYATAIDLYRSAGSHRRGCVPMTMESSR